MANKNGFHEEFNLDEEIRVGSPRAFGFVFAVVFSIVSLWPLLDDAPVRLLGCRRRQRNYRRGSFSSETSSAHESSLVPVRHAPAQGRQSVGDGLSLLSHSDPDRPRLQADW